MSHQSFEPHWPDLIVRAVGEAPEPEFTALTDAAARLLGCPVALLSLLDEQRQWFKARTGFSATQTPLDHSFCRHALAKDGLLVVEDATQDPRFAANPLVTGPESVRFYAGQPVHVREPEGRSVALGALCVIAPHPRRLSDEDAAVLQGLAKTAGALLEARVAALRSAALAERLQRTLAARNRLHRSLMQAERMAKIGSWRLVLDTQRVEWSDQVYAIHEVPLGESEPLENALQFYPPHDRALIEDAVSRAIEKGTPYDLEVDFVTARGRQRRVRAMGELEVERDRPVALIGVFQDVTEKYQLQQTLEAHANTDELTRIASRRHFNKVVEQRLAQARTSGDTVALALIDLDHFKAVNDRLGHAAGDNVLVRAASTLMSPWLRGSFAARLGGDEFVLLIDDPVLIDRMEATVERLLAELRQPPMLDGVVVSATIGVARAKGDRLDRAGMLATADKALYAAKARMRGTAMLDDGDEQMWIRSAVTAIRSE